MASIVETYGNLDNISIITMAPEKENALEVIEELTKQNVTVSLGHSMANFTEGEEAIRRGSNLITHLFNAMLPVRKFYANNSQRMYLKKEKFYF